MERCVTTEQHTQTDTAGDFDSQALCEEAGKSINERHEKIDTVVHQLFVDYPVVETAGLDDREVVKRYDVDEEIASRALKKAIRREQSHFGRHLDY
ncbi:MAG: hypothetical protein Q4B27_01655 [Candidatus Saccharibacteria bacterium]|nr:hypothetical protein [Candidatus Saccharibacteria bacterium]